jgi:hypothetical protein
MKQENLTNQHKEISPKENLSRDLVPEGIHFYMWDDRCLALELETGVFLSRNSLKTGYSLIENPPGVLTPVQCELLPVKVKDIELGDFIVPRRFNRSNVSTYRMHHGFSNFCGVHCYPVIGFALVSEKILSKEDEIVLKVVPVKNTK